ncbi:hypothetical protein IQ07DRAFT_591963 [Pyrenochaeta sp. DS3sAY3a]|nr:hypothetical protein IQ07DRAFT_591963 [Pyrenochaeta sp. DS3sAY3a]
MSWYKTHGKRGPLIGEVDRLRPSSHDLEYLRTQDPFFHSIESTDGAKRKFVDDDDAGDVHKRLRTEKSKVKVLVSKLERERDEGFGKLKRERDQLQADLQREREKFQADLQREREKFQADLQAQNDKHQAELKEKNDFVQHLLRQLTQQNV